MPVFFFFPQWKDFYFKQLEKVRIGDPGPAVNHRCSLLCVSSFYGLTFVGCKEGEERVYRARSTPPPPPPLAF